MINIILEGSQISVINHLNSMANFQDAMMWFLLYIDDPFWNFFDNSTVLYVLRLVEEDRSFSWGTTAF